MQVDFIAPTDTAHVSCCAMDGLSGERDSPALGGACSDLMTYADAAAFCDAAEMRLCTPDELPVTCGSGCQYDAQMVWTLHSDPGDDTSGDDTSGDDTSGDDTSGDDTSGECGYMFMSVQFISWPPFCWV